MTEPREVLDWEGIRPFHKLERIRVPGGWIYRTVHGPSGVALCFVPEMNQNQGNEDDGSVGE